MAFVKTQKNNKMTEEKEIANSHNSHNSHYNYKSYYKPRNFNSESNKKYLRPCMYLERCTKRADGRCGFAHSIDELQPMQCMFDKQCNKFENGCVRFHPSLQTKEEYCDLSGFSFTSPLLPPLPPQNDVDPQNIQEDL